MGDTMHSRIAQRLMWAVGMAMVSAVPLMLLASRCGNVHGEPRCDLATPLALLFVVPSLVVESWLFGPALNSWAFWVVFELVAFVIVVGGGFAVLSVVDLARRR